MGAVITYTSQGCGEDWRVNICKILTTVYVSHRVRTIYVLAPLLPLPLYLLFSFFFFLSTFLCLFLLLPLLLPPPLLPHPPHLPPPFSSSSPYSPPPTPPSSPSPPPSFLLPTYYFLSILKFLSHSLNTTPVVFNNY